MNFEQARKLAEAIIGKEYNAGMNAEQAKKLKDGNVSEQDFCCIVHCSKATLGDSFDAFMGCLIHLAKEHDDLEAAECVVAMDRMLCVLEQRLQWVDGKYGTKLASHQNSTEKASSMVAIRDAIKAKHQLLKELQA